jgi:hypothetical protein
MKKRRTYSEPPPLPEIPPSEVIDHHGTVRLNPFTIRGKTVRIVGTSLGPPTVHTLRDQEGKYYEVTEDTLKRMIKQ